MREYYVNAIYQLALDYHSGQASRGYRLLCRCQRYARWRGIELQPNRRSELYKYLAAKYADRL